MIKTKVFNIGMAQKFVNEKYFADGDTFAVITITQSKVNFNYNIAGFIDHLIIPVDDIDQAFVDEYPEAAAKCGPLFDSAFAAEVKAFVKLNKDLVDYFVIHCDAGVSRSRALAAALEFVFNGNDGEHFENGVPNPTIYKIMLAAYGMSNEYTHKDPEPCPICGEHFHGEAIVLWYSEELDKLVWAHPDCKRRWKEGWIKE